MEAWMIIVLIIGAIIAIIVNVAAFTGKKKNNISIGGGEGRYDVPKKYHYKPSKNDDDSGELYGTDGKRIK